GRGRRGGCGGNRGERSRPRDLALARRGARRQHRLRKHERQGLDLLVRATHCLFRMRRPGKEGDTMPSTSRLFTAVALLAGLAVYGSLQSSAARGTLPIIRTTHSPRPIRELLYFRLAG